MTISPFLDGFTRFVRTAHAKRAAARGVEPPKLFKRLYIANAYLGLVVAIIIATGLCGLFALSRSQTSSALLARTLEQATDASEITAAAEREYADLLSQTPRDRGRQSGASIAASRTFTAELAGLQRNGSATDAPALRSLTSAHRAFEAAARAFRSAIARGNRSGAMRIDAHGLRPNVARIRSGLRVISAETFRARLGEMATDRAIASRYERLIVAVTGIAVALMAGLIVLLRLYRFAAMASAATVVDTLAEAALTDNLTKLGNQRAFNEDFARERARAARHGHPLALALIDVDDFKKVNDEGGHSHGDEVLSRVGERLRRMRTEDRGYRIGGDEFALILAEADPKAAATALMRLQKELRDSLMGATVSIGYVNLSGPELVAGSYDLADAALYEAKRSGRNRTVCFRDSGTVMNVFSPAKGDIVRKMISEQLVTTVFQPIWDMESNRPLGFEALMRPNPGLGLDGPQEAFDVAERIRQLPELDRLCTRNALNSSANLPADSVIFVNYSPTALIHPSFDPAEFVALVRAANLRPEQIVVEVSERRIDDATGIVERATALRALGIRIALDNIGSGHVGLEIMSRLHLDFVKLDRALVSKAIENTEARGVLAGLIAIARETGSYLIAEGIETRHMLDFVSRAHIPLTSALAGVRGVQGYELGKPEAGKIDLQSLEDRHDYLEARRGEVSLAAERRSDRSDDRSAIRVLQATP
jgi:diguanylate cyclase (GGDEF)-like protein